MRSFGRLKIDIFNHILPKKVKKAFAEIFPPSAHWHSMTEATPTLWDMDARFRIMDKYEVKHVITLLGPGIEEVANPEKAAELVKFANDEMANLVYKFPDRFVAAIASLPMNNIDGALNEIDRAINDLHFRGIQLFTPINDKPLDSGEFLPIYEKMSKDYNLPILMHPWRNMKYPDYSTESESKYNIWHTFGWPYETTAAMTRLVFSGVLEKYPNLKVITHHCGAMVPYFAERIVGEHNLFEMRRGAKHKEGLTKPPIEYFKMFYADTVLHGNPHALMCAHHFFGADHLLFATDMPMDSQLGDSYTRETILAIEEMEISKAERDMIFAKNARNLMRLPI
jgi:predicted TIM-barrel fold metal-dependent hydrolase